MKLQHCVRVCTTAFDNLCAYTIIKPYNPSQKEGKKRAILLHPAAGTATLQGEYAAPAVCVAFLTGLPPGKPCGEYADA